MDFLKPYVRYIPLFVVGTLAVFTVGVWVFVLSQTPSGHLKFVVMDVGQGDSLYIESPTGVQMVIDGGPDNSLLRELPKVMPMFDHSIDAIMESHPHADHVAGFVDLLKRYQVGAVIEPGVVYQGPEVAAFEKEVLSEHIPRYLARRGMVLDLGGGAILTILYPDSDVTFMPEPKVHEGNIVARLVYGQTSIMLMGDAPEDVEARLLAMSSTTLKSDILKVGHHGSKTSSSAAFLAAVHPKRAIISVGAKNKYHHPTQEALDRLADIGAEVFRIDQKGTVEFESDGKTFWRVDK